MYKNKKKIKVKMCMDCLNCHLNAVEEYASELKDFIEGIECECGCKEFPTFILGVSDDLKILCSVKLKITSQKLLGITVCNKTIRFEEMVKLRIKNKLEFALCQVDEVKQELNDSSYLSKMNQLKMMNDFVKLLDDAEHR